MKVLVEGEQRVKIEQVDETEGFFTATVLTIDDAEPSEGERKALAHTLMAQFEQYVKLSKKISSDVMSSITNIDDPSRLADTIASQMNLKLEEKQNL